MRIASVLCLISLPLHAGALPDDPAAAAFVRANLVSGLYHEAGHALIDVLGLPHAGEEDAVDAFAALMIDRLWPDREAEALVRATADAFLLYAQVGAKAPPGPHSLDVVRYYNLVCLFYGADPDARAALAVEFGLAEERWESCPEEAEAASSAWNERLAGMPPQDHGPGLRLVQKRDQDALTTLIASEIGRLNGEIGWPERVDVSVEPCDEANAFYDPRAKRIVICTEYAADLAALYDGSR